MTELLETVEHETGPHPQWSVLWLHGLGADGHDFAPIVPELLRRDWPAVRFVFPHAPVRAVTINGGARMRAWYDIRDMNLANRADSEGVAESVAQVEALIAREAERGIGAERLLLAGFSQGGAVTLAAGIARTRPLAGLVALSTYLPLHETFPAEAAPESLSVPIFMGHGHYDPVVPESLGIMSRDWLKALGCPIEWKSYPMPHSVCLEEVKDIGRWLQARMAEC